MQTMENPLVPPQSSIPTAPQTSSPPQDSDTAMVKCEAFGQPFHAVDDDKETLLNSIDNDTKASGEPEEPPLAFESYSKLEDHDVLVGRGGGNNNHPGSNENRNEARKRRPEYQRATCNKRKREIAEEVIHLAKQKGGRFVIYDKVNHLYVRLTDANVLGKTMQYLRTSEEKTTRAKKQQQPRCSRQQLSDKKNTKKPKP